MFILKEYQIERAAPCRLEDLTAQRRTAADHVFVP